MNWTDHVLVLVFAVVVPAWGVLDRRRTKERLVSGGSRARLAHYATEMALLWLAAAVVVARWIDSDRGWNEIGLALPDGWGGAAVAVAGTAVLLAYHGLLVRRTDLHDQIRSAMSGASALVPRDRLELRGFAALGFTAGVCEEVLYRGYLAWYAADALGPFGGHLAAAVLFGAAHLYLGVADAVRAFVTGCALAALYAWSGSLLPSMVLHVAIDVAAGWLASEVLSGAPEGLRTN